MTNLKKAAEEYCPKSVIYGTDMNAKARKAFTAGAKYEQERAKVLLEALEIISQPFNNDTNYIDRAVRAQEKAWDALKSYKEGE